MALETDNDREKDITVKQTDRHTDTQTDRQTDTQTYRHTQTDRQTHVHTKKNLQHLTVQMPQSNSQTY